MRFGGYFTRNYKRKLRRTPGAPENNAHNDLKPHWSLSFPRNMDVAYLSFKSYAGQFPYLLSGFLGLLRSFPIRYIGYTNEKISKYVRFEKFDRRKGVTYEQFRFNKIQEQYRGKRHRIFMALGIGRYPGEHRQKAR